ncbi:hypothetical protein DY000_02038568 [Brassica cretica]|uniref:Uncharacterized protein n=1 Tax=Brassica cretica TaxID=69181 RepID=A0ABQ7BQK4_BRACR|nr:hypothetical protein DY000_02038568 [Brassica cretica]
MLLGPAGEGPGPRRFSSLRGIVFAILLRGEGATLVIVLLRMPVPSLLRAEVPAPDFDEEDLSKGSAVCGRDSLCCGAFSTQIDLAWPLNPEFAE